jgi:RNA polymerase sigma-70 factor, ECF subfamily
MPRDPAHPNDATLELPFLTAAENANPPSHVEKEVTELFGLLRQPVLRYLLTFGLPAHDGEEVVQEVFLALFQHLRRGKDRSNLRGWVFRVAHNLALKQRMAGQRQWTESGADLEQHSDDALDPEQQLALTQKERKLRAVLRALPETDQRCLSLRAEGLRYREIAEVLGISLGSVSISLARSLARFEQVTKG